ncbi:MAG: sce7725 family protein [Cyclobacteriaceae bacterium]|nr:sce7725 family protein [Cyclobacteriaceae bacterium]
MYFPYIRGKQYDLIAMKELGDVLQSNGSKISPIIEPVKDSPTLKNTLADLASRSINFNIIVNPSVGDLTNSTQQIIGILENELVTYSNYQIAILVDQGFGDVEYLDLIRAGSIKASGFTLIHNAVVENPVELLELHQSVIPVVNNIVNFQKTNRRYDRNFEADTVVSLEDFFNAQNKNADFLNINESFFSEEHLFFKRDGIKGFSDFLTIGESYSETGFLPYAVVIHLTYADQDRKIRIRHFVSDSNNDSSDIGGKFAEALDKLIVWVNDNGLDTLAVRHFRDLHYNGHFPGLGSLKKLSIMNHIEIVLGLI